MTVRDVAVIIGSLRRDSLNRKLANALIALAPPSLKLSIVEIGELALSAGVCGVGGAERRLSALPNLRAHRMKARRNR
jgi:NAD(P)H-dependent FMN reductase